MNSNKITIDVEGSQITKLYDLVLDIISDEFGSICNYKLGEYLLDHDKEYCYKNCGGKAVMKDDRICWNRYFEWRLNEMEKREND